MRRRGHDPNRSNSRDLSAVEVMDQLLMQRIKYYRPGQNGAHVFTNISSKTMEPPVRPAKGAGSPSDQ